MGAFQPVIFSQAQCGRELQQLEELLSSTSALSEREHVLPFFRKTPHLASYIGSLVGVLSCDRIAHELSLEGSFTVDLAIGDSSRRKFVLIEFEDAKESSIFVKKKKLTPDWSPRFLGGLAQLSDWLWLLDDIARTERLKHIFGTGDIDVQVMLIIGRSEHLDERTHARLRWLENEMLSKRVRILTFDSLLEDLKHAFKNFSAK